MSDEIVSRSYPPHPEVTGVFIDWPYPSSYHPWQWSHNAIRAEFKDLDIAAQNILNAIAEGEYESWMGESYQFFGKYFNEFIHHHHRIEDDIWFPFMKTRLPLPDNFHEEHVILHKMQDDLDVTLNDLAVKLKAGDINEITAKIVEAKDKFDQCFRYLLPHLIEEETVWLPLLLQTFSKNETKVPDKKMVSQFSWYDLPQMYRKISKEEREEHMKKALEIPGFVITYILSGNFKKYDRIYRSRIEEIVDFSKHKDGFEDSNVFCDCVIS